MIIGISLLGILSSCRGNSITEVTTAEPFTLQSTTSIEEKWIEERDQTVEERNSESSVNENEYNQSMSL